MNPDLPHPQNRKIIVILVILGALALLLAAVYFYFKKAGPFLSIKPQTVETKLPQTKVYKNDDLGFIFTYPSNWTINESVLKQGTTSQISPNYSAVASDGEVFLVKVSKADWLVSFEAQKQFAKDPCGGMSTSGWNGGFPSGLQNLKILGKEAMRATLEKGTTADIFGLQKEPYFVQIVFKRLPGELPGISQQKYPNAVKFCSEEEKNPVDSSSKPLRLKINYHSPTLTKDNVSKAQIDQKAFEEMDKIISSLSLI